MRTEQNEGEKNEPKLLKHLSRGDRRAASLTDADGRSGKVKPYHTSLVRAERALTGNAGI